MFSFSLLLHTPDFFFSICDGRRVKKTRNVTKKYHNNYSGNLIKSLIHDKDYSFRKVIVQFFTGYNKHIQHFSPQVTDSGYHTFYMTCNDECELWFDGVEDLEGLGAGQSERKMLIKLVDMSTLERLTWDRYAHRVNHRGDFFPLLFCK